MWPLIIISLFVLLRSTLGDDPQLIIRIDNIDFDTKNNPWVDKWEANIEKDDPENIINVKMPIKSDVPENIMIKMELNIDGNSLADVETTLCDAITEEMVGVYIVAAGMPEDKFPKECPVGPGDFEIVKYKVVKDKLPSGLPTGKLDGKISIMEPDQDPFMVIQFDGEILRDKPGMR